MKVLVINCGSSSLKFQLINMENEDVIAKGNVERIGIEGSFLKYQPVGKEKVVVEQSMKDHNDALKIVIDTLVDKEVGVIKNLDEISAVGHRVVHGGEYFSESVVIDEPVIKAIEDCVQVAPLHNPPNLMGIAACKAIMPNTPMVAVFDTAFHQTLSKSAYLYAIPYSMYEKYKIRKYGFHGTSHKYVSGRAIDFLKLDKNNSKVIVCHLGNGSSVTAVLNGKSVETSMGFTPLAGLEMGTRCGNIDPAIVPFLMEKENLNTTEISNFLNKKCGMLGLTEFSSDFRDIEDAAMAGNEQAQLALDVFSNDVKQFIAAYAASMGGIDALVFTAGVGENSDIIREKVANGLQFLGIEIDSEKNKTRGKEVDISKDSAKVRTLVIPTNEELMIARDTKALLK